MPARPGNLHRSVPIWYNALERIDRRSVIETWLEQQAKLAKDAEEDTKERAVKLSKAVSTDLSEVIREQTLAQHAKYLKQIVKIACENSVRKGHDEKWCCPNPVRDHLLRTCTVLNPASRLTCIACGYPKPEGKNLVYRTLITWIDWSKENEPSKLVYSAWQRWKKNIRPAKMRFMKNVKKVMMINRFKGPMTAIQVHEETEAAQKRQAQKAIDDRMKAEKAAKTRLKTLAMGPAFNPTKTASELKRDRTPSISLNEAILKTIRANEVDPAGAEARNDATKKQIIEYREHKQGLKQRRQQLLDRKLDGLEASRFRVEDPFSLDRDLMFRTLKRQKERNQGHRQHITQILEEKADGYSTFGFYA